MMITRLKTNHITNPIGFVMEDIGGIHPVEEAPGFRKIEWKPMPDYRMSYATVTYDSPARSGT